MVFYFLWNFQLLVFPHEDVSNACSLQWQDFRVEYAQTRLRKIPPETAHSRPCQ